ncbi:THO complex subunit 4B-like isoform X2 [Punica granatum]|uniref:THO complex subunit 4B-like isoform X2 n=1 Tax=Punica granatum TaxID=22663 RepID=A0A218WC41_PUNGR|nr:THO complex subunit 4B-like isoform X2 [Punica granatum]OWM70069.1 hypothetical protein CDL15_Pgr025918 [Punica granatum]
MAASLDMALDDIIRNNRRQQEPHDRPAVGRVRRPGSCSGAGGPARRFNRASLRDAMPYAAPPPMPMMAPIWEQQMPAVAIGGETTDDGNGIKLYISNLDYGVTNDDLMLLFSTVGELERYSIHCDKSGRSKGTAEVVFTREADAIAAIKRYNNVLLDGKPMMIEIVGKNLVTPAPVPLLPNSILGRPPSIPASGQWIGVKRSPRRGMSRGLPWGRAQARAPPSKPSAKDLDAELERYHLEALKLK